MSVVKGQQQGKYWKENIKSQASGPGAFSSTACIQDTRPNTHADLDQDFYCSRVVSGIPVVVFCSCEEGTWKEADPALQLPWLQIPHVTVHLLPPPKWHSSKEQTFRSQNAGNRTVPKLQIGACPWTTSQLFHLRLFATSYHTCHSMMSWNLSVSARNFQKRSHCTCAFLTRSILRKERFMGGCRKLLTT